jgi:uncharacterized protein (TIGR01777 family)
MRLVIAGGTGFLGRPLAQALVKDGHTGAILSRSPDVAAPAPGLDVVSWTPDGNTGSWATVIDGSDAVVNLAGESIAGGRWTAERKRRIRESRILATRSLVRAIAAARKPPRVLVSGSAVGYYGPLGDEIVSEDHPPGHDFLAEVCQAWEAEARIASSHGRVVLVRTGLVLERDGGALSKMLLPFRFGAGGPVGSGRQYWPWIHRTDWISVIRWALGSGIVEGAINATAPNPVTNAEFARTLGQALHRPAFLPAPASAMRLLLGEMADALLLSGQRAVPAKAERLGFGFAYPALPDALEAIFGRAT